MSRKPFSIFGWRRMVVNWSGITLLCIGWLMAHGCGQKAKGQLGGPCLYSSDCEAGLECIGELCGLKKKTGDACILDVECGTNLKCYDKKCAFGQRKSCTQDAQCGSGNKCFETKAGDTKFCASQTGEGLPCASDADCEAGGGKDLKCSGGYCLKPVGQSSPCPDSESCLAPLVCASGGTCVQPGQPGTGGENEKCSSVNDCQKSFLCDETKKVCTSGGSEGLACQVQTNCRNGLICSADGKCAKKGDPGTAGSGEACNSPKDCQAGLVCGSQGSCAPPGAQKENDPCVGSEQCADNLVCASKAGEQTGICSKPGGPGTKLAGESCDTQADCSFPLACGLAGTCVAIFPYAGTSCEDPNETKGGFRVFFEVPRKDKEVKEFYRLPFPNDIRLQTNGRVSLAGHANPGPLLGEDLVGKYINAIESQVKGFGTQQVVLMRFSKTLDFSSLTLEGSKPSLFYINLTRKQELGRSVRFAASRGNYICHNSLSVRPFGRLPLNPGETYAVLITNTLKSSNGDAIQRDDDFDKIMSDTAPTDPDMLRAHTAYQSLRDYLKENAQSGKWPAPGDVVAATVFTTQVPTAQFAQFRDVIQQRPEPKLKEITLCDGKNKSPCETSTDTSRACGTPNDKFYEIHAKVELPIFQKGTEPYKNEGGEIEYDGSGKPVVAKVMDVCVAITIPKGVDTPADGWPVVLYSHGTGGDFRSHIVDKTAERVSEIETTVKDDQGNDTKVKVHYATLGIDQTLHGPRRGTDTTHPNFLFFNFRNPHAALNNPIQGAADQFTLVRLLKLTNIPKDQGPIIQDIRFDKSRITFLGHSQGGIVGPLFLAYEPDVKVAILSGAGGNLIQSLLNKTKPVDIATGIRALLGEAQPIDANHPMLNLLQLYFDRNDPANYGHLIAKTPPKDVTPKHILQTYGLGDSFTPPSTMEILALTMGVQQIGPTETSIAGISDNRKDPPGRGNLTIEGKPITATFGQYRPKDYDGHFVIFQHEDAIRHFTQFLATFATDKEGVPSHVK